MTPEQKRIEELERQLAKQNDTMEAIVNVVICLHGDVQNSDESRFYVDKSREQEFVAKLAGGADSMILPSSIKSTRSAT